MSELLISNELLLASVAFMSFLTHKLGTVTIVVIAVFSRNSSGRVCTSGVYLFVHCTFWHLHLSLKDQFLASQKVSFRHSSKGVFFNLFIFN